MDTSWMLDLETMDRRAMLRDLDAAIERARAEHRPEYLEECLTDWELVSHRLRTDRVPRRARHELAGPRPGPC